MLLRQLRQRLRQKRQELLGRARALATDAPLFSHHRILPCVLPRLPSNNRRTSDVARCLCLRPTPPLSWGGAGACVTVAPALRQKRQGLLGRARALATDAPVFCVGGVALICSVGLPDLLGVVRRMRATVCELPRLHWSVHCRTSRWRSGQCGVAALRRC